MSIAFRCDTLSLVFGPDETGVYVLCGVDGKNEVFYGRDHYWITSGGNGSAKLYFDLKGFLDVYRSGRIEPGIKVE